ncbi:TetR/AcrR family transcriptional regulator [Kribbella sandramycini]|uniref:AcrR family transcriptional regulator n=1 Tax=Kribbella sandramycini TaxID=60450 RepID=A0A7Y4L4J9_9ACTN|nr:TetR/AcrR family transcriptional regulator [Kribbella sandramycini]MBB6571280.1 AcrR family transcriptional regulator [Kribbella sandramycini]NOL43316.1 TetR/AcrR family transcriptional regulator [Kribbella sandramycini]
MSTTGLDRRTRRRQETIEEILAVAIELMETEGVAALSMSAVARRLGMRPPSLYQYFPSKAAIYDALFQRGGELIREARRAAQAEADTEDPRELDRISVAAFTRWCLEHQVYSQLLFWRTVPGFEPSPEAYAPAQEALEDLRRHLQTGVDQGILRPEAAGEEGLALYTSITGGVIAQQIANEPDASYDDGRYVRLMPIALDMFYQYYAPTRGNHGSSSSG